MNHYNCFLLSLMSISLCAMKEDGLKSVDLKTSIPRVQAIWSDCSAQRSFLSQESGVSSFAVDGDMIALARRASVVIENNDTKEAQKIEIDGSRGAPASIITHVAIRGDLVACVRDGFRVMVLGTYEPEKIMALHDQTKSCVSINHLAWAPDGRYLCYSDDSNHYLYRWDGKSLTSLDLLRKAVGCNLFSWAFNGKKPGQRLWFVDSKKGAIFLDSHINVNRSKQIYTVSGDPIEFIAAAHVSNQLAISYKDQLIILAGQTAGRLSHPFDGDLSTLSWHKKDDMIAAGDCAGRVCIWRVPTDLESLKIKDGIIQVDDVPAKGMLLATVMPTDKMNCIQTLAWKNDSTLLAQTKAGIIVNLVLPYLPEIKKAADANDVRKMILFRALSQLCAKQSKEKLVIHLSCKTTIDSFPFALRDLFLCYVSYDCGKDALGFKELIDLKS